MSPMELGRIYKGRERLRKPQLHKRMSWQSVWQIVRGFARQEISREVACVWLGISRARLYVLRRRWLEMPVSTPAHPVGGTWLYQRKSSSRLKPGAREFLRGELKYLKEESPYFKGHYNFAVLAEQCRKRFGGRTQRSTVRNLAIREGYYDPKMDET